MVLHVHVEVIFVISQLYIYFDVLILHVHVEVIFVISRLYFDVLNGCEKPKIHKRLALNLLSAIENSTFALLIPHLSFFER